MKPHTISSKNTNRIAQQAKIAALIFAGGRGERMGRVDKAQIEKNGRMLIDIVSQHLRLECDQLYISRQKDQDDLSQFGTVLIDEDEDQGPFAGLVTACKRARKDGFEYLLTSPVDTDVLPDLIGKMLFEVRKPHAVAMIEGKLQPTLSLINLTHIDNIVQLYKNGARSLRAWIEREDVGFLEINGHKFRNFNNLVNPL